MDNLSAWCLENDVVFDRSTKRYVKHKENDSVYGMIMDTNKGLMFRQFKWAKTNDKGSLPRVFSRLTFRHKLVGEEIWNSFEEIHYSMFCGLETMDMSMTE